MARFSKRKERRAKISAFRNPSKCKQTGKTRYKTEDDASLGMMRAWGHDPDMNIMDYHTYQCPDCHDYHFGNRKHYEKYLQSQANLGSVSGVVP